MYFFFPDFQFGYGLGIPGPFNPFLFNPGWIDSVYSSYGLDYLRQRTSPMMPPNGLHTPLGKGRLCLFTHLLNQFFN